MLLATRFARAGRRLLVASLALLALAGFSPIGVALGHLLENRFPPWDAARGAPDGIIVLGGAISPRLSQDYGDAGGQRRRRAHHRDRQAGARLSERAHRLFRRRRQPAAATGREANFLYPLLDSYRRAARRA